MSIELMLIFGVVFILFVVQSIGGFFQIKDYRKSVRRVSSYGKVGVGQRLGKFFTGYLVLIACDKKGIITRCEVMNGVTFLSRFREKRSLLDSEIVGNRVTYYMEQFRHLNKRDTKELKGYIQAMDALCKYLYPDCYTEKELHEIVLKENLGTV